MTILAPIDESKAIEIVPETRYGYLTFLRLVFHRFTRWAILGATLMITQSFLCNAIFFTYALVLINFYHVPSSKVPLYRLAFSIGNLLGPASYGALIGNGSSRTGLFIGYLIGAGIMLIGGLVEGVPRRPGRRHIPGTGHQATHLHRPANPGSIHSGRIEHDYDGVADRIPAGDSEPFVGRRPVFHTFWLMKRALARGGMVSSRRTALGLA